MSSMFLMATSAIGPGFITQTTNFTVQLGAAFAFATHYNQGTVTAKDTVLLSTLLGVPLMFLCAMLFG